MTAELLSSTAKARCLNNKVCFQKCTSTCRYGSSSSAHKQIVQPLGYASAYVDAQPIILQAAQGSLYHIKSSSTLNTCRIHCLFISVWDLPVNTGNQSKVPPPPKKIIWQGGLKLAFIFITIVFAGGYLFSFLSGMRNSLLHWLTACPAPGFFFCN